MRLPQQYKNEKIADTKVGKDPIEQSAILSPYQATKFGGPEHKNDQGLQAVLDIDEYKDMPEQVQQPVPRDQPSRGAGPPDGPKNPNHRHLGGSVHQRQERRWPGRS